MPLPPLLLLLASTIWLAASLEVVAANADDDCGDGSHKDQRPQMMTTTTTGRRSRSWTTERRRRLKRERSNDELEFALRGIPCYLWDDYTVPIFKKIKRRRCVLVVHNDSQASCGTTKCVLKNVLFRVLCHCRHTEICALEKFSNFKFLIKL